MSGNHEYYEKSSPTLTRSGTMSDQDAGERQDLPQRPKHLALPTEADRYNTDPMNMSPAESRDHANRLVDDLTLLKAERAISNEEDADLQREYSRVRTRDSGKEDIFNQPAPETAIIGPPPEPPSKVNLLFNLIRKLPRMVRYFLYSLPVTAVLLAPIFLGIYLPRDQQPIIGGPGGVQLLWFGIWLEIIWLSLWASRIVTSIMPWILNLGAKIMGSGNAKKWRDIGKSLELHMALFLWMLAVLISYFPILNNHKVPASGDERWPDIEWIRVVHKVVIALFALALMNFIEKVLIQWVAMTFHTRTYSTRIETNKQSIAYLVHLYEHSKDTLVSEAEVMGGEVTGSGAKTPIGFIADNAREAATKIGDIANRVAGDFTGRQVRLSNHPRKVVSELLRNTGTAQVLARRLFRTYAKPGADLLTPHDLNPAFPTPEDAEAAFYLFDRDLNGDVSMEELEAYVDEVHREKKAIAASLKDLDSVITKLDRVFFVCIIIITIVIFISIFSSSSSAALTSAGTAVLGLSWLLQATAQEFLQSIIFVFVKHPFDVGDRITVYGSTGATLTGDDYYVTEISLLYTEFKKMEGHMVQAPNSVLNEVFILNHRRSGQLADVFELRMKYGTSPAIIKELEARMTEYVLENKRDFAGNIITELRGFEDAYCMTLNLICFHKTSYQNELLRLIRHNKFALALLDTMVALGIEQPRREYQISGQDWPVYQANVQPPSYEQQQAAQPHRADPSLLVSSRRPRASSRASDGLATTNDMYQDVFSTRKASHPKGPLTHPPRINEEPSGSSQSAMASGALERLPSNTSARESHRGLFRGIGTLTRRSHDQGSRSGMRPDNEMV
ncbi:hypothetical protein GGR56DRAFT_85089 [Xylariaceae sp. FL0804]|nr:hypothetical protein GGR56DRAFT_85089 [Xylariaceae sp. FL0804]